MRTMRSTAFLSLLVCAACGTGGDSESSAAPDTTPAAAMPADSAPPPSAPSASTDGAWTVRFDGAGPLRVGMTFDEARTALGGDLAMNDAAGAVEPGPDRCDLPRSAALPAGVRVMVEGQRVVRVQVDSGATATAEGARIGDGEARIQQLYGDRMTVQPHKYTDGRYLVVRPEAQSDTTHLLVFETEGGVVRRFRAGQKPQVEYVEGCG
jgi:hypothetical protein